MSGGIDWWRISRDASAGQFQLSSGTQATPKDSDVSVTFKIIRGNGFVDPYPTPGPKSFR